ncbi:hypothetical protein AAFF_G00158020 [Aldrovandia affinis]|uniref:Uncharacterized protein n=1 Tax=Aldrovandia affinis TaxID=143900 RepID=A0AAD7RQT7_9TELE|nr:hypothetical protein AAFF_G00158020 [Aldrovandia affinis]
MRTGRIRRVGNKMTGDSCSVLPFFAALFCIIPTTTAAPTFFPHSVLANIADSTQNTAFSGCESCSEPGCAQDVQKVLTDTDGEYIWRRKNSPDLPDCGTALPPLQSPRWVCEKDGKMYVYLTEEKTLFFEGNHSIKSSGPLPLDKCPALKNNTSMTKRDGGANTTYSTQNTDVKSIIIGVGIGVPVGIILLVIVVFRDRICCGKRRKKEVRSTGEEYGNGTAECEALRNGICETALNGGTP